MQALDPDWDGPILGDELAKQRWPESDYNWDELKVTPTAGRLW